MTFITLPRGARAACPPVCGSRPSRPGTTGVPPVPPFSLSPWSSAITAAVRRRFPSSSTRL
jgi:hypothetical protein